MSSCCSWVLLFLLMLVARPALPGDRPVLAAASARPASVLAVRDFGAIADGTSHPLAERFATLEAARRQFPDAQSLSQEIDLLAVQAAAASGKSLDFGAGHYFLGTITEPGYRIAKVVANNLVYEGNGARFTVNTKNGSESRLFSLHARSGFHLRGAFTVTELGSNIYPTMVNPQGIVVLELLDAWSDVVVDNLTVLGARGGVQSYASSPAAFGTGGRGRFKISARRTYYPLVLAENGDRVQAEVTAQECGRPVFVYGVRNFNATVTQRNNHASYTSIIKRYQRNTSGIRVRIDSDVAIESVRELISLDHQNNDGPASIIEDVSIEFKVSVRGKGTTGSYAVVNLAHYPLSGPASSVNSGTYRNIVLNGAHGPFAADANSQFTSSTTRLDVFHLRPGRGFGRNLAAAGAVNLNAP